MTGRRHANNTLFVVDWNLVAKATEAISLCNWDAVLNAVDQCLQFDKSAHLECMQETLFGDMVIAVYSVLDVDWQAICKAAEAAKQIPDWTAILHDLSPQEESTRTGTHQSIATAAQLIASVDWKKIRDASTVVARELAMMDYKAAIETMAMIDDDETATVNDILGTFFQNGWRSIAAIGDAFADVNWEDSVVAAESGRDNNILG